MYVTMPAKNPKIPPIPQKKQTNSQETSPKKTWKPPQDVMSLLHESISELRLDNLTGFSHYSLSIALVDASSHTCCGINPPEEGAWLKVPFPWSRVSDLISTLLQKLQVKEYGDFDTGNTKDSFYCGAVLCTLFDPLMLGMHKEKPKQQCFSLHAYKCLYLCKYLTLLSVKATRPPLHSGANSSWITRPSPVSQWVWQNPSGGKWHE